MTLSSTLFILSTPKCPVSCNVFIIIKSVCNSCLLNCFTYYSFLPLLLIIASL